MQWQYTPYIVPLLIATAMSATLAYFVWQRGAVPGLTAFIVLMLAVAEYSLGYALEIGSPDLSTKIFWGKVQYLGIVVLPVAWLVFALRYTHHHQWLTRRNLVLLTVVPLLTVSLVWTNEVHQLIWSQIKLTSNGPFVALDVDYGAWFWIHSTYSYLLLLLGTIRLFLMLLRSPHMYRQQATALLLGSLAPWVGNGLYLSGLGPVPNLDLTPFAFALSGLIFAWGLLRLKLLDIVPVARRAVVDGMSDGVMVLDLQNRIVDLNPVAKRIIGPAAEHAIGQPVAQVLTNYTELLERYRGVTEARTEITLESGEKERHYDLHISPLTNHQNQFIGRVVLLHDITARKQAEAALRNQKQLFENLVAVARATAERPTLKATLQNALSVAANLTGAELSSLFLLDERGAVTHSIQAVGNGTPKPEQSPINQVMDQGLAGWVAAHHQAALIYDTRHDNRWLPLPNKHPVGSALAVPIMSGSTILGILTLAHAAAGHFNPEHLHLMQAAADHMALAVRNGQIFEAQRRLADRQIILYEIVQAVAGQTDPDQVVRVAVDTITQFTDWSHVLLALPSADKPQWTAYAVAGGLSPMAGLAFPIKQDAISLAFKTGLTQQLTAASIDPNRYVDDQTLSVGLLAVPLRRNRRVLGVLGIENNQQDTFDSEDVLLAEALAEALALAYDNARLHTETQQRLKAQTALQEASAVIASTLDLASVLNLLTEQFCQAVDATSTYICSYEPETMTATVLAEYAGPEACEREQQSTLHTTYHLQKDFPDLITPLRTGHPSLSHLDDPNLVEPHRTHLERVGAQTTLIIPLQARDETIAYAELRESRRSREFTSEEIALCQSIAQQAAVAIEHARLYDDERRHAAGLSALYMVTRMAGQSLVLEDVLSQVLSSVLTLLGFEAGLITLSDPTTGRLQLAAEYGLPSLLSTHFQRHSLDNTLYEYVHTSQEIMVTGDLGHDAPVDISELKRVGFRAYAGIPLLHRKQSLGSMNLFTHQAAPSSTDNLALLSTIGHQVATAVANARLFQTIADERSRLQALIESSRDGIILVGMDRRVLVTNAPTLNILGLSGKPADWTDRPFTTVLGTLRQQAPAAVRATLAEMRRIRRGDEPSGEGEHEVANRTIHWLNLPVVAGSTSLGRLIVLRDVTEERLLEKMRDDITHTMVHDLRNPLTSISGSLQLLQMIGESNLLPEQRKLLEIARNSSQGMMDLVNGILDVSRLESGQMPLERVPVSIATIITETIRGQSFLAADKELLLESDVDPLLPATWADPKLIERVLQNLVGNAIKFTPLGGSIRITAKLEEDSLTGMGDGHPQNLQISIADNGTGITPEIKNRLFQKFVTGRQEGRGSGLGLAFCKLAVEAHEGRIWVESEPGQGTTFYFTLPIANENQHQNGKVK